MHRSTGSIDGGRISQRQTPASLVGDSGRCAYALVELEDATPESIYWPKPGTPYFTPRFDHGYLQIVDWLCLLDDTQTTSGFRDYWGDATPPQFVGVLVIGPALY